MLSKFCFPAILLFCLSVALDHRTVILAQAAVRSENAAQDLDTLIRDCICKGSGKVITGYTYTWEMIRRGANRLGQIYSWSEIYEVYVPPIRHGRLTDQFPILISMDGRALPPEAIAKARLRAGERLQEAERAGSINRSEDPGFRPACAGTPPMGTYFTLVLEGARGRHKTIFTPVTFLRSSEFHPAGRDTVNGREMIVLEFKPRQGTRFAPEESYASALVGKVWIDAEERVLARLEAWPKGRAGKASTAVVLYEQVRQPEGTWLPGRAELNADTYGYVFGERTYDMISTFRDYHRFSTSIESVETVKKQP